MGRLRIEVLAAVRYRKGRGDRRGVEDFARLFRLVA